jgi:hypothetical protein
MLLCAPGIKLVIAPAPGDDGMMGILPRVKVSLPCQRHTQYATAQHNARVSHHRQPQRTMTGEADSPPDEPQLCMRRPSDGQVPPELSQCTGFRQKGGMPLR